MGLLKEFKEFAVKGSAIDMAVGIIIGGAFGKIVTSLVNDVIMPPIGMLTGGVDFSDKVLPLPAIKEGAEAVFVKYGVFINQVVDFIIVAFCIFLVVKAMNAAKRREAPKAPPGPSSEEKLLAEIRDLLKNRA